jgi:hypothetical protein
MTEETTQAVEACRKSATIVRTLAEALASTDERPLWTMNFKGIPGTAYVFAATEHSAKLALIGNVANFKKVTKAEKAKLTAQAYADLLAKQAEGALDQMEAEVASMQEEPTDEPVAAGVES